MEPVTILPHSGRRLVGTLALQIMSIVSIMSVMSIMSKNETMEHGQDARATLFCKARCCGRGRPRSRFSALLFTRNAWSSHSPVTCLQLTRSKLSSFTSQTKRGRRA